MSEKKINTVYDIFKMVGNAILQINGNNTNSGNLSLKDPEDPSRFYITASGSQLGALIPRDVVPVRFKEVSWGDGRASTESNIHRRVLSLPGINACVHSHFIASTVLTFDTMEHQLFLKPAGTDSSESGDLVFQPVDIHGASLLGKVKTGYYKQPVGSLDMEERIPQYLAEAALTLVRGHGPFARGVSLEECMKNLAIFDNSAILALTLARRGIELGPIQNILMEKGCDSIFAPYPHENISVSKEHNITDVSTIEDFAHWLSYVYNTMVGAYNTGSMSRKVTANEMIYCPASSVPMGYEIAREEYSEIEHVKQCREISSFIGNELGDTCIHNIWIPDGSKDVTVNRYYHRSILKESLDVILSKKYNPDAVKDSVESKLFGIGLESYTVGSHEFYLGYAIKNNILLCLDIGHFHPTEHVSDKVSAVFQYIDELLFHVTRPVRWDSDHVVTLNDEVLALTREIVWAEKLDNAHLGLDFFDAGINRIGAYVVGTMAAQKALLLALLDPIKKMGDNEDKGQNFELLAMMEEAKVKPFGAVWDYYCLTKGVPVGEAFIGDIQQYEKDVLSKRA